MPTSQIMILYELYIQSVDQADAGPILADIMRGIMSTMKVPQNPCQLNALNLETRLKTGSLLLVTGLRTLTSLWKALCLRIGSTSWLQGSDEVNNRIQGIFFQYSPILRYPLKEDLHDIYTNAMTVY